MFQCQSTKDTVVKLQRERKELQNQLLSLKHHVSLHRLHIKHTYDSKGEAKRAMDAFCERLRLLGERRTALVSSHSASVRGRYAREYQKLFAEHTLLEDRFRRITASRTETRYNLQKLIIDATRSYGIIAPSAVSGPSQLSQPPPIHFLDNSRYYTLCSRFSLSPESAFLPSF